MCLAILKPANEHIIKRRLRQGFQENPDGAGFMYVKNGQLKIDKGYFSFRSFYKAYRQAEQKCPDSNFVIHFRIATSGKISSKHCHPFLINTTVAFVHNGIFAKLGNKVKSDTQHFNNDYLRYMPPDFIHNKKSIRFLEKYCGWFNKLIFLNNKNEYLIVNESAGRWLDNIWFSNIIETSIGFSVTTNYATEIEDNDWGECAICTGYYPTQQMQETENGQVICEFCFTKKFGGFRQEVCYGCGQLLDIYDTGDDCPYCGADLKYKVV